MKMLQHACAHLAAAGASSPSSEGVGWKGHLLSMQLRPDGHLELWLQLGPATADSLFDALTQNPETGWAHALTDTGSLVRRLVATPAVWVQEALLAAALDRLVEGEPDPARAAERRPLLRVVPEPAEIPRVSGVAAAAYLLRAVWGELDARHVLAERASIWNVTVAGSSLADRAIRSAEEGWVLRALMCCPEASTRLLATLTITANWTARATAEQAARASQP
jgi:hypothetical protein